MDKDRLNQLFVEVQALKAVVIDLRTQNNKLADRVLFIEHYLKEKEECTNTKDL